MILCVGTLGSGKSALLQALKQYGQECTMATDEYPMDMTKEMEIPYTTPTAGSKDKNFFLIKSFSIPFRK